MKVKNTSSRLVHVGGVACIPGEEAEIDARWKSAIPDYLVPVESEEVESVEVEQKKRGRKPKADDAA